MNLIKDIYCIFCLIFLLSACSKTEFPSTKYEDEKYGFSLYYPENWEKKFGSGVTQIVFDEPSKSAEKSNAQIRIDVRKVPSGIKLSVLQNSIFDNLKKLGAEFTMADTNQLIFNNLNVVKLGFTLNNENGSFKNWLYIITKKGLLFELTLSAPTTSFESYRKIFESVVNTFEIQQ